MGDLLVKMSVFPIFFLAREKRSMIGTILHKVRHGLGKTLEFGGNALRKIGDFAGKAADFTVRNGSTLGTLAGLGIGAATGNPALGVSIASAGHALQQHAASRPVQNTIRGIRDVGNAAGTAANRLLS